MSLVDRALAKLKGLLGQQPAQESDSYRSHRSQNHSASNRYHSEEEDDDDERVSPNTQFLSSAARHDRLLQGKNPARAGNGNQLPPHSSSSTPAPSSDRASASAESPSGSSRAPGAPTPHGVSMSGRRPNLTEKLAGKSIKGDPVEETRELSDALHDALLIAISNLTEEKQESIKVSAPRNVAEPRFEAHGMARPSAPGSYYRFRASTSELTLTVRATSGLVELFVIPTDDVPLRSFSEYGSRLKGRFELVPRADDTSFWALNRLRATTEAAIEILVDCLKELTGSGDEQDQESGTIENAAADDPVKMLQLEKQNLIFKVLNDQEVLKNELARTLHDTVLADLLMLKRHMRGDQELQKEEIIETIDEIAQALRDICNECAPRNLHDWGLKTSLHDLLQRLEQRTGIKCTLNCQIEIPNLPANVELHVFRLMQEAVNNVEKHAGASQIEILIESRKPRSLYLSVRDNGKGFSPDNSPRSVDSGGMGVSGMKERVALIRCYLPAEFGISSESGKGTTLFIELGNLGLD